MQMVKVRRVGNSNVISLPREFEEQGFTPGATVIIEALPTGELRIAPATVVRRLSPTRARQLAVQHQVLLDRLAEDDGEELSATASARLAQA